VHTDIPSSLSSSVSLSVADSGGAGMEYSPYAQPLSPPSPDSSSSRTDSDSESTSSPPARSSSHNSSGEKKKRSHNRRSSYSETDNDDTDSTHSSSSSSSFSFSSSSSSPASSDFQEAKKRRCVVSAQKLTTDTSTVDLSMSIIHFQHHSIRIIHTTTTTSSNPPTVVHATYVHGADVGGVIERKSNISRMFGQFLSPREKILMNVTGKHNHTVGQEANVLTVDGVERLMGLKKCIPNVEYTQWLREVLVPVLKEGKRGGQRAEMMNVEKGEGSRSVSGGLSVGTERSGNVVDGTTADNSPLDLLTSVCV